MPTRRANQLLAAAVVVGLVALLLYWGWQQGAERRAIMDLPREERAALYQRELESLRTLCGQAPQPDLQQVCRRKAELIVEFPECDRECKQLARSQTRLSSR